MNLKILSCAAITLAGSLAFFACSKSKSSTPASPNYADSVKRSLWAYYNFNGTMNDQSGNNHNITPEGNLALGLDIWGNANDALDFNGSSNYAVIDSGTVFPGGNFSISFMVMPRNTSNGRIFQKVDYTTATGASFGFGMNGAGSGQFDFFVTSDSVGICSDLTTATNTTLMHATLVPTAYAWYFVTLVFDNGMEKVYINGQLSGSQATPNTTFATCSSAAMYLGTWWAQAPLFFDGKIDELRIYTRVLSDNEIGYLASDAVNPL